MYEKISQIRELVDYCLAEYNINNKVDVLFNARLTGCVGRAKYWHYRKVGSVEFSTQLWSRINDEERENTIIHEVAHIIAFIVYGKVKPHGWEWQSIHRKLGSEPRRTCDNIDTAGITRKVKKFNIECDFCGYNWVLSQTLITRRENKIGCIGKCKCGKKLTRKENNYV